MQRRREPIPTVARRGWVLAAGIVFGSFSAPAYASDSISRSAARQLGNEGVQAYQAGDYTTAVDKLERAYAALQVPSLALWSARALERTGKLLEASERYLEGVRADISGDRDVQARAQKDATAEREKLLPRIPKLTIHIEGAPCEAPSVSLNAEPIPSALVGTPLSTNPGHAAVLARCDAERAEATEEIDVAEGSQAEVTLRFLPGTAAAAPAPTESPVPAAAAQTAPGSARSWQPVAGWVAIGVGGASLILGGVTGGLAMGKVSELGCDSSGVCPPGTPPEAMAAGNTLRDVSTIGFIAGGVLAAAGITLLLTTPHPSHSAYVAPFITATSVGLEGAF